MKNCKLLLLLPFMVGSQARLAAQYFNPEVQEKLVRRVLILPPRVQVQKLGMRGVEIMSRESEDYGTMIQMVVSTALKENGFDVLVPPASSQAGQGDDHPMYIIADIQSQYDRIEPLLNRKPKDIRKGRFSLGDEVLKVDPGRSTDALVFIRAYAVRLTKGKQVFGLLVPTLNPWPNMTVSIVLVDSKSGDVLFFTKASTIGDPSRRTQVLAKPIRKSFRDLTVRLCRDQVRKPNM